MRLAPAARVAVIGAGPSGLLAAKFALAAGFEPTVFEAGDDLGGQWHTRAAYSGVWPDMPTNTSRPMTCFSDFPPPADLPLHPLAEQVHDYLRAYARQFDVTDRVRLHSPVIRLERGPGSGWRVDGEPYDAVVVASGRFRKPRIAPVLNGFRGDLQHAFDYAGAADHRERRTLVYGNGVSGNEIASDIATVTPVVSAFRKPRYVLQKVVDGVSSDWQWYTEFTARQRRSLAAPDFAARLRAKVLRVAGNPADFGAPEPDPDILVAGHSLAQHYLSQVAAGRIVCRPEVTAVDGQRVTFADGAQEAFDAIISATGYDLDLPYLSDDVRAILGPELRLYQSTLSPDLPTLGLVGQFVAQGPYFPLLELQARWVVAIWSGQVAAPTADRMRAEATPAESVTRPHDSLAVALADELGVAPDLARWPELAEPLLFGPMLPARYRLGGPDALPDAATRFREQLASSRRAAVDPADVEALAGLGLADIADRLRTRTR